MKKIAVIFAAVSTLALAAVSKHANAQSVKDSSMASVFRAAFEKDMPEKDVQATLTRLATEKRDDSLKADMRKTFGDIVKILNGTIIDKSGGSITARIVDAQTLLLTSYYKTPGASMEWFYDVPQADLSVRKEKDGSYTVTARKTQNFELGLNDDGKKTYPNNTAAEATQIIAAWTTGQFGKKNTALKINLALTAEKAMQP